MTAGPPQLFRRETAVPVPIRCVTLVAVPSAAVEVQITEFGQVPLEGRLRNELGADQL